MASSTSRSFSAADQRRRRCTDVITSTRGWGASEFVVIVVFIGLRLCLIELCQTVRSKRGAVQNRPASRDVRRAETAKITKMMGKTRVHRSINIRDTPLTLSLWEAPSYTAHRCAHDRWHGVLDLADPHRHPGHLRARQGLGAAEGRLATHPRRRTGCHRNPASRRMNRRTARWPSSASLGPMTFNEGEPT